MSLCEKRERDRDYTQRACRRKLLGGEGGWVGGMRGLMVISINALLMERRRFYTTVSR